MKVLIVHMEYPPIIGGGGRYTQNLVKGLSDLGIEVVLLTSGESDSTKSIRKGLTIKRYKIFNDLYHGNGDMIQGIDIIIEQIRKESPDILHTEHSLETLVGQIANSNFGLPHFVTHHKTPLYEGVSQNGKWSLYNKVNSSKSLRYIQSSEAFKNSLLQSGVDLKSIDVVYPGVNRDVFKDLKSSNHVVAMRDELQISKKDYVVLLPCLVRQRKGVDDLVKALSKVKLKDRVVKVIITGLARSDRDIEVIKKLGDLIHPHIIVDHRPFKDEDMPVLYNIADLTILGSKAEGLGISLLEAMSCGCPIVGTDVMGINEIIEDSYNGRLFEYGNLEDFNSIFTEIALNQNIRDKYVKNAYTTLEKKFNLEKQAKKHVELYENAIGLVKQSSGGVLFRVKNKILEIYLAKHSSYGYVLPKGGKDSSETWLETAIREVEEETGYSVSSPSHLIGLIEWSFQKEDTMVYKECMFYGFEIDEETVRGDQKLEEGEQVEIGKWFKHTEVLDNMAHETEKDAVKDLIDNIEVD